MVFLLLLFLILAILLGGGYYAYRIAFYSPKKGRDIIHSPRGSQYDAYREEMSRIFNQLSERPCEFVTVLSQEGLRLSGRYYHVRDGAPLDIGFHGYRGTAIRDFCGGTEISFAAGHHVLLVDQRAHGASEGDTITFGVEERRDCLDWVRYACARFGADRPILLYGVSMGAATVLMAAGLELPANVRGIIADSPYSTPEAIIRKVCRDLHLPDRVCYPILARSAARFGRFRLSDGSAVEAVRHAKVPILLIHGEDDRFVPCEMSREILDACASDAARHTFPGAGHGLSYVTDPERYTHLVLQFFEQVL